MSKEKEPEMKAAPAVEVEKTIGEPVKLVRLTGCLPMPPKAVHVFETHFEVPIIEAAMFMGNEQFGPEHMDNLFITNPEPLNPMVGVICRIEDAQKFREEIHEFFTGGKYAGVLKEAAKGVTFYARKEAIAEARQKVIDEFNRKRERIESIKRLLGLDEVPLKVEDITKIPDEVLDGGSE